MKKLKEKIRNQLIDLCVSAETFLREDRGDTNFISIAIILIVVIALAVVFIGFKDQLLPKLKSAIDELLGKL